MVLLLRSLWTSKNSSILAEAQKSQAMPLSSDLLNGVVESIFTCLEAEASTSLRKRENAACPQNQDTIMGGQLTMAYTPSRVINKSQQHLFDEPHGIFQDLSEDRET